MTTRLSSPIEDMKPHYTVVVIGSGYGGAITASRMARAGQSVCVLERGKEIQPGEYPNTEQKAAEQLQANTSNPLFPRIGSRLGMFNFHLSDDISVLVGCGLGGTSLINANVSIRADRRVFNSDRWPEEFRNKPDILDEWYKHAEEMLRPVPLPESIKLSKLDALEKSAESMNQKFYRLNINVTFEDGVNQVGVEQKKCVCCGDCVSGCNYRAKNTVLMNYLPDARNHGAEIFTQVSVLGIERNDGRWLVRFQPITTGEEPLDGPTMAVSADIVVLAAGVIGSTEILLRSKEAGLPMSDMVGKHFSGNGDVLGFGYNTNTEINGVGFGTRSPEGRQPVGPTITGVIDMRDTPDVNQGIIIEEGAIPGAIGNLLPAGLAIGSDLFGRRISKSFREWVKGKLRQWRSLLCGPYHGAIRNTQTYLLMSHDDSNGEIVLNEVGQPQIKWPGVGKQPIFKEDNERLYQATVPLGGTYLENPEWSKLFNYQLTSVHPLGGCVMADDAAQGVANHKGQVYSSTGGTDVYEGLYVNDGSIIPLALGVNPLLTISGIAERCCHLMAEDRGWRIDYEFREMSRTIPAKP